MKVFLAGTSLAPSYGGPAYSVARLATALAEAGLHVGLWTPDQAVATMPAVQPSPAVRRLTGSATQALDAFGDVDVLHDNGLWLWHNHRLARLATARRIPRVVSTRGMLEPWAINHKRTRKRLAWAFYQRRDLLQAACLHATAGEEAGNLQRFHLDVPVHVIPNGIALPAAEGRPSRAGVRTALFLGRLYPVKGLPMLIEAWSRVRPEGWHLRIAGPDEAGHRRLLQQIISAARLDSAVSFMGPLDEEAKHSTLLDADLLVLPSHSESFGMVVGEALAHAVPVLTTRAVPWPMLEERGAGWRVDPTVEGLAGGLAEATTQDSATLAAMGRQGRALIAADFQWKHVTRRVVAMYENVRSV